MKRATTLLALVIVIFIMLKCKQLDIVPIAKVQTTTVVAGIDKIKAQGKIVELISSDDEVGFSYSTSGSFTNESKVEGVSFQNKEFNAVITGLTIGTKYFVRAYCKHGGEVVYGETKEVSTISNDQFVTDYDGNKYAKVTIGTQVWLGENLKVTHFRNGDPIPNVSDAITWNSQTTPAYCNFRNIPAITENFGALYNYYTTIDSRGLCPTGWHVPTESEWNLLFDFLGGASIAGGKMKEVGVQQDWSDPSTVNLYHWQAPNAGATNESGFTAVAGGFRKEYLGSFESIGDDSYFWSSQEFNTANGTFIHLSKMNASAEKGNEKKLFGHSVRCIQGTDKYPPVVTTGTTITSLSPVSATISGVVTSNGGGSIIEQGVCYSSSTNPTIDHQKTTAALTSSTYSCAINALMPNYTYYARAYAKNEVGVSYGDEVSFTTSNPASIVLSIVGSELGWDTDIDFTYDNTNGSASYYKINGRLFKQDEDFKIRKNHAWDLGAWGYNEVTINGEANNFEARTAVSPNISVKSERKYDVILEVLWGNNAMFLTMNNITPSITTNDISDIYSTTAQCGGNVISAGTSSVSERGICWSTSPLPTIALPTKIVVGLGVGTFSSNLTGLSTTSKYYIRAYATNSSGTSYGEEKSFTAAYKIGEMYGGGYVFYVDGTGLHGLVCANVDQATDISWYGGTNALTSAQATDVGTGMANTNTIVGFHGAGTYAAKVCYDLVLNTYNDWYLPSKDELNLMYINLKLNNSNQGGFPNNSYWSSSEVNIDQAWFQYFGDGGQGYGIGKGATGLHVRAVRSF